MVAKNNTKIKKKRYNPPKEENQQEIKKNKTKFKRERQGND